MTDAYKKLGAGLLYAGVAALVGAMGTYLVSGFFGNVTKILLIVGVGLLLGYVVVSPEVVLGAVRSRGVKYGGNTLAMIVLLLVIVGAANWFTASHSQNFDLTRDKLHTLTSQTVDILKGLNQDVKVTAFFQTNQFDEQQAKDLLAQYAAQSSRIQYRFIDPDKDPVTARQFGIVSYGTTVFQAANNRKDVPTVGEQEFTSAILAVSSTERRKIYFVTGNGQPDPGQTDQQGFHDALVDLQNSNYVVDTLDATSAAVPDDASAVVLVAGNQPLLAEQKTALADYLAKGGKMLIASGAFAESDLNDLLTPFGLKFQPGVTIDTASFLQQGGPQVPAVSRYASGGGDIVKNLPFTVFPLASGIAVPQQRSQGITTTVIAQTSDQSWLQNHKDTIQFQSGDIRGPINLVVTAEGTLPKPASPSSSPSAAPTPIGGLAQPSAVPTLPPPSASANPSAGASAQANAQPTQTPTPIPKVTGSDVNLSGGTRVAVVADVTWMTNQFLNEVPGNRMLFLNLINHLVGNQNLVSIPEKAGPEASRVNLLGSDANLVFFTTVVFVPLAVLVVGGFVWWSRR